FLSFPTRRSSDLYFPIWPIDFFCNSIPDKFHFLVVKRPVLDEFLCTQLITTMYNRHFIRKFGQIDALFHGRISATDDNDVFLLEKATITYSAVRYTATCQILFTFNTQSLELGTGPNNACTTSRSSFSGTACFVIHIIIGFCRRPISIFIADLSRLFKHIVRQVTSQDARISRITFYI